jgi:hypothetical protein
VERRRLLAVLAFLLILPGQAGAANLRQRVAQLVESNDVEGIRASGTAALPELARLYESGTEDRRVQIAGIFYQLGWRSPDAVLLKDVRTANPTLRVSVQYALGKVSNDPKVVATLLDIMRHDANPHFRDKAACALTYDQPHLTEAQKVLLHEKLIDALSDPEPQVQAIAILALSIRTGQIKGFHPNAPLEKKRKSIEAWKKWLAEYRASL